MTKSFLATRARRGFTLVEMLIVIAIIGLLAAISFPVFAKVRENGRSKVCLSNMKQLGLAFQQYQQDSGGRLPRAANYQAWSPGHAYWVAGTPMAAGGGLAKDAKNSSDPNKGEFDYQSGSADVENGALFPYVKSSKVYVCPSTKDGEKKHLSYSMNCAISLLAESRFRTPSEIIVLVDEAQSLNDGYFWASKGVGAIKATDELTQAHNGGGNLLFADGHVKYFPFKAFPLQEDAKERESVTIGTARFRDLAFGPNGIAQTGFVSNANAVAGQWPTTGAACFSDPLPTTPPAPVSPIG